MGKRFCYIGFLLMSFSLKAASQLHLNPYKDTVSFIKVGMVLPQNFYNQHTGFFCQQEVQLQKSAHLPVYIRLGSKEYVDYLERKPNARKN